MPSIKRKIARNTIANVFLRVSRYIIGFLLFPYIVYHVGTDDYGLYLLVGAFVGYFGFLDLGIGSALVKYVAEYTSKKDYKTINEIVNSTFIFYMGIGVIICISILIIGVFYVDVFNIESGQADKARTIAYLTAIGTLTSWPLRGFATAIQGLQRYDLNAIILFIGRVVNAGATIVILDPQILDLGIIDLIYWGIVIGACTQVTIVIVVQRLMPFLTLKREHMKISTLKKIFKFSSVVFIGQIVGLIVLGTDRIVIGAFVSVGAITFYAVARNIHDLVHTSSRLSESALLPAASELNALDKKGQLEQLVMRGSKYKSALLICTSIIAIMLAEPLIRHWMGTDFLNMVLPTRVYIFYWLFFAAWGVMGPVLLAKEMYRPILFFNVTVAISNLILSLILVQYYGVLGVVMGTTIPYFVIFPILVPYGLHLLDINYWRYLKNSLLISYIIGGVTALVFFFILFLYTPNSLLEVVILGLIGFCIYFGIFYVIGLTPKERRDVKAFLKLK